MTQNSPQGSDGAADRGLGRFRATAGGGQPFDRPTRTPRLLLRSPDEHSADIDGAWWPRTDNLTTELHDLIAALTARLGKTVQIAFNWNSVSSSQRVIDPPDGIEVTGPLPGQATGVMYVFGPNDQGVRLLVIDPAADPDDADAQMRRVTGAVTKHSEP